MFLRTTLAYNILFHSTSYLFGSVFICKYSAPAELKR
jgi:hypothetical protein